MVHVNLAVYMAFLFVGVFIGFFLLSCPGILLEARAGQISARKRHPLFGQARLWTCCRRPMGAVFRYCLRALPLGRSVLAVPPLLLRCRCGHGEPAGETMGSAHGRGQSGMLSGLSLRALVTHVRHSVVGRARSSRTQPFGSANQPRPVISWAARSVSCLLRRLHLAGHGLRSRSFRA